MCVCVLVRPPPFPILNPVLYFAVAYAVIKPIVTAPRSVPIEYISTLSKTTVIIVQCDLVRRLETVMVSLVIAKKRRIQTFFIIMLLIQCTNKGNNRESTRNPIIHLLHIYLIILTIILTFTKPQNHIKLPIKYCWSHYSPCWHIAYVGRCYNTHWG